jgi:hypothetical protein
MKAMPTMPRPTTTILLRCDGGSGYFFASFSSSVRAFRGSLLIAMPGEEVAQDISRSVLSYNQFDSKQCSDSLRHMKDKREAG